MPPVNTYVVRYSVPDQFTFLLPSMLMIAIFAGIGLAVLCELSSRWRRVAITIVAFFILFPPLLYAAGPALLKKAGVTIQRARSLMGRSSYSETSPSDKLNRPSFRARLPKGHEPLQRATVAESCMCLGVLLR